MVRKAARGLAGFVRYSLEFPRGLDLPLEVRARAKQVLFDVAASLQQIPAAPAWWAAMGSGLAELNLAGWRFEYRIDRGTSCIQVMRVRSTRLPCRLPR
jgi:hypothetical protein